MQDGDVGKPFNTTQQDVEKIEADDNDENYSFQISMLFMSPSEQTSMVTNEMEFRDSI